MLQTILQTILAAAAAALAAACVFLLALRLRIESSSERRVNSLMGGRVSMVDRYGDSLLARLGISPQRWKTSLKWAQMGGHLLDWTAGGILARALLYGGGMALIVLFLKMPLLYAAIIPVAAYYPFMRVSSEAEQVRKLARRMLPELATLIAAEMGAGAGPEVAVTRAARQPGPLGQILNEALNESKSTNRPLFKTGAVPGALVEVFSRQGLAELARFGAQVDRVAGKGVEGSRVMNEIARGFARDYRAEVTRASAQLDSQLLVPMTLGFFLPFIGAILLPVFYMLLGAF